MESDAQLLVSKHMLKERELEQLKEQLTNPCSDRLRKRFLEEPVICNYQVS